MVWGVHTMTVTLEDGTELPIHDHMRDSHRKGTQGLSEEFLASVHRVLHQRHAPDLEHTHADSGDSDPEYLAKPATGRG